MILVIFKPKIVKIFFCLKDTKYLHMHESMNDIKKNTLIIWIKITDKGLVIESPRVPTTWRQCIVRSGQHWTSDCRGWGWVTCKWPVPLTAGSRTVTVSQNYLVYTRTDLCKNSKHGVSGLAVDSDVPAIKHGGWRLSVRGGGFALSNSDHDYYVVGNHLGPFIIVRIVRPLFLVY